MSKSKPSHRDEPSEGTIESLESRFFIFSILGANLSSYTTGTFKWAPQKSKCLETMGRLDNVAPRAVQEELAHTEGKLSRENLIWTTHIVKKIDSRDSI